MRCFFMSSIWLSSHTDRNDCNLARVFFLESKDSEYAKLSENEQNRDIKKAEMSQSQIN